MIKLKKTFKLFCSFIFALMLFQNANAQIDTIDWGGLDSIYWNGLDTIDWNDNWGYDLDSIDWSDWYTDCDTIFITSFDQLQDLDTLDWYNCYIYEFADSLDWNDYWDDWYADCDTILIESFDDLNNLDTIDIYDWDNCYIYVYSDSLDWDQYWDDWYTDCDTIIIDDYTDWDYLDTLDWSDCYHLEYADGYWDFPIDTFDWENWFANCDTVLIETVEDLIDLEFDYYNYSNDSCFVYVYADDFDWQTYFDSIVGIDSLGWYNYGYFEPGFWNGEDGDCGFNGYIETNGNSYYADYSDATVTVLDEYGNVVSIINPDTDGSFDFTGLPTGDYTVIVNFDGLEFELESISFEQDGDFESGVVIEEKAEQIVSIEDVVVENLFTVYPNPTVNFVNVNVKDIHDTKIIIQNSNGKIMAVINNLTNNVTQVNVNNYPTGNYIVSVINNKNKTSKTFTKVK